MNYQPEIFMPYQQKWVPIATVVNTMADAIRLCWHEQSTWYRLPSGIIPDCRIVVIDGKNDSYVFVPYDPDFMDWKERNDEIVVHLWRCAEQSADIAGKMYDAMMNR